MAASNLPSYRNYSPAKTAEQRKTETAAYLYAACDAQREILSIAIQARTPFQRWISARLKRHWHQILAGAKSQRAAGAHILDWPRKVKEIRTTDLYLNRGQEGAPAPGTAGKLSIRGEYLEELYYRYLALLRENHREAAIRESTQEFGDGPQRDFLVARLKTGSAQECEARETWRAGDHEPKDNQGMWDEDADLWSVGALAKAVFGLVASTYIMELGSYMDPKSPAGITVARLARHNIDALNAMIEVNTPAQVRVANRLQSRGVARGATMGDLLSTVRLGTYYAAVKFHPRPGANGFVGYCLQTIASQVKREMTALRTIQMPESKLLLVAKMHGWRGRNLQTYGTMSLAEQMEAAQIRGITVHEMSVILQEDQETSTLSVEAMAQAAADHGDDIHADIGANILHDRGEGAERIRDTAFADPRLAVLRPAFLRLSPLHQGLLASLYTCSATDGGDVAWLKHIHERSTQVIHAAVGRIRSGIASQSQVAAGLTVRY